MIYGALKKKKLFYNTKFVLIFWGLTFAFCEIMYNCTFWPKTDLKETMKFKGEVTQQLI